MNPATGPLTADARAGGDARILVVEDDPHLRHLVQRRLQQAGLDVITASSGEEALRLADHGRQRVSLLITDGIMPGMDGFELARRFGEFDPPIRAILISGFLGHFVGRSDIPGNVEAFFPKPFSGEELVAKILDLLGAPA